MGAVRGRTTAGPSEYFTAKGHAAAEKYFGRTRAAYRCEADNSTAGTMISGSDTCSYPSGGPQAKPPVCPAPRLRAGDSASAIDEELSLARLSPSQIEDRVRDLLQQPTKKASHRPGVKVLVVAKIQRRGGG